MALINRIEYHANGSMAKQSPLDLPGRYLDLDLDLTLKNIGKVS